MTKDIRQMNTLCEPTGKNNLSAYSAVECLSNYKDQTEIESYRKRRLAKYMPYAEFIEKWSKSGKLRVVEVGSGSSALLYAMDQKKLIEEAVAVEISKSRNEFAQKWKRERNYFRINNLNENFANIDLPQKYFDWYIVVDNTFAYLYPENSMYPVKLLRQAYSCLKQKGFLLLEFNNYMPAAVETAGNFWTRFHDSDPFKYALYCDRFDKENNIIVSESIYIDRNGQESVRVDISYFYTVDSIRALLSLEGFVTECVCADVSRFSFDEKTSPRFVLLARKNT